MGVSIVFPSLSLDQNPSPSIEIEKKSQPRLFIVTPSFNTQFCVSLLFLELVLQSYRYKCLLFS